MCVEEEEGGREREGDGREERGRGITERSGPRRWEGHRGRCLRAS